MKSANTWQPSKFVYRKGKLRASRDKKRVWVASRLMVDIIAEHYDRHIRHHVKGRLLDLGCGNVPLYEAYRKYVTENICVDWGNTLHKNVWLDYEYDLNRPIPLETGSFDTIILSDVLEHIAEPDALWREMHRLLRTGGKLLISVPFYYWLHEEPHDYFRYTRHALKAGAEKTGFHVVLLESMGGVPEILADILAKNLCRVPGIGDWLSALVQYMTRLVLKTRAGRNYSRKTAGNFPLGYFMICEK